MLSVPLLSVWKGISEHGGNCHQVHPCIMVPFYLCVQNKRVNKLFSVNSFSSISLLLSFQSVGVNDSLQSSEFYPCFCCFSRRGKSPSVFKFFFPAYCRQMIKIYHGYGNDFTVMLPILNCKTYDCSIKISCKFFSYGEFSL